MVFVNLEQAERAIVLCLAADVPVALWGPVGVGKSSVGRQIATKLGFALYKSAEALALCGAELEEAVDETHRGYRHGLWVREEAR